MGRSYGPRTGLLRFRMAVQAAASRLPSQPLEGMLEKKKKR
jgi:hypothetical protein